MTTAHFSARPVDRQDPPTTEVWECARAYFQARNQGNEIEEREAMTRLVMLEYLQTLESDNLADSAAEGRTNGSAR